MMLTFNYLLLLRTGCCLYNASYTDSFVIEIITRRSRIKKIESCLIVLNGHVQMLFETDPIFNLAEIDNEPRSQKAPVELIGHCPQVRPPRMLVHAALLWHGLLAQ